MLNVGGVLTEILAKFCSKRRSIVALAGYGRYSSQRSCFSADESSSLTARAPSCLISFPAQLKRTPSLRVLGVHLRARNASIARAVVMFVLVVHAGLVTVTHHHGAAQRVPRASAYNVEASPGSNSSRPLGSSGERCCISCCLQRNFVTSVRPTLIPSDFCSEPVSTEPFVSEPSRSGVPLVLSNRAPPDANPVARLI